MKTLEEIKAELRKANPKWSDSKLNNEAQAAFVKQQSTANKPTLDWNTPDSGQDNGVLFGFGINERVLPLEVEGFVVNLIKNNKSAYAKVQSAVKQVTGRTISDPTSLGAWVGRLATNMIKDEEVAKNVTVESFLRAAAGSGVGAGAGKLPTKQIYPKTPQQIADIIEQVSLSSRDKGISQDEMKESWYKNLTKAIEGMVQQGVTQKTYTKGGFKVTEQQVGFTEQKAQTAAAQAIAAAKPTDVKRQQDISFMDWVFQNAPKDLVGGK